MLWFYAILLTSFVVVGNKCGSEQLFNDKKLYKYENNQLEREAFRRINRWMIKNVPLTTLEESLAKMNGLIRKSRNSILKNKLFLTRVLSSDSVDRYVIQAIRQLKATTLIDDSNRCSDDSNRLLLRIFNALFIQDDKAREEEDRLQYVVAPIFWFHAIQCHDLYTKKFVEIIGKLSPEVKESVDNFLDKIVNIRFIDSRVDKDEVAVMMLESLRAALPSGERIFKDKTFLVDYEEKRESNVNRLKELLERYLRCREYYQALGPQVFELDTMDSFFHQDDKEVPSADYYQSWSKVRICKWIVERPDKMASNMLYWAAFEPSNSHLYY